MRNDTSSSKTEIRLANSTHFDAEGKEVGRTYALII